jgi:hypothetical protein
VTKRCSSLRLLQPERSRWTEVVASCPWATWFHTPMWNDMAQAALPHAFDSTVYAELEDGALAVFPLLEQRGRAGRRWRTSAAFGAYGGPVAERTLDAAEVAALFAEARRGADRLTVTGNPYATVWEPPRSFSVRAIETVRAPLTKDMDVESTFAPARRRQVRKGRKLGVTCRVVANEHDYASYFEIYQDSLDRWGERASSRYPWDLFTAGVRCAATHPTNVRLWLAELDGRAVAGAWIFGWNQAAIYWHGATRSDSLSAAASSVVLTDAMTEAACSGYEWFDFNPSSGHEGVREFKLRFGSEETGLNVLSFRSPAERMVDVVRRRRS